MTNRPKNIGTAAETAVVNAARRHGFPGAERRALHGATDLGDILLCPGVILEVKGGVAAKDASDRLVAVWLAQTETERLNAGADVALLVTQRRGIGAPHADRWWAHTRLGHLDGWAVPPVSRTPVRLTLAGALDHLRSCGYGEPLDTDPAEAADALEASA